MEDFVDLKIDGKQFANRFDKLHQSNQKATKIFLIDIQQLKNLESNPKCFGFTEWTSEADLACDEFYPDFQPQDQVEFAFARDEEDLRTFIADVILPQIQKFFNEE